MLTRGAAARSNGLVACPDCDLLQRPAALAAGEAARCGRCGARLYERKENSLSRTLALALAALILFAIANLCPFMTLSLEGRSQECTIFSGVTGLAREGMGTLALLVFLVSVLVPFLRIAGLLHALALLRLAPGRGRAAFSFRWIHALRPWGMLEILLLAGLVALVKLGDVARIEPGAAFWAFCALILVNAAAAATLDPALVWRGLERRG
ncbi:MAG: paraquat-inducible protein A [Planctomycetes bacterium]|nr:paraquat-inducible protein A [Planctomycetota bacterium]